MFLDVEDYRPDPPRVPSAISRREGILLSLLVHAVVVLGIVLLPDTFFRARPLQLIPSDDSVRFVAIEPLVDRSAPPKRPAPMSDLDRRSTTREQIPKPLDDQPLMRGNSQEKVEGAPNERAAGADSANPAPGAGAPAPPNVTTKIIPQIDLPQRPAGGSLGDSLRNLQRYLQDQNLDNQKGGQTELAPDIQFDSKGADFGPWLRRFRAQVYRNWFVPQAAALLHGHVVLQLNIHRDGSITDLRVVQPSAYESFNNAAFTALKLSNPTMPLPAEYPADVVLFTVTFFYNERIR